MEKRYHPVMFVEWKEIIVYLNLNVRPFGLSYNICTFYYIE
jgi:hypothetical protein